MTDIASLGLSVDSSGVDKGVQSLDKLAAAAGKAEGAADGLASTSVRAGAAHDRQAVQAKKASDALHAHGNALKLTGQQATQLSYQLNDVAVSLAGGMSPLTVLMQQGSQITPIFGGVRGTLSALGTGIRALMTPTMMLGGGLAALGASAAYGFMRWTDEQKALDASLQGIGRRAGVTASALANLAASGAATGGLSVSSGRDLAATYAGAGIGGMNVEKAIGLTKTFARVTGQDLGDAGTNLAKALQDPTKGLETLNAALGFADEKTRVLIKSFAAQGDIAGAQRSLLNALAQDLKSTTDNTGALSKAWDAFKRSLSDTGTGIGKGVDRLVYGLSVTENLTEETKKLIALRAEMGQPVARSAGRYGVTQASVDAGAGRQAIVIESRIEALERVADRADRLAAGRGADQRIAQQSGLAAQAVYSALPELERRRALDDQIILLEKARDDPAALERMGMSAGTVTTAIRLMNDQLGQTVSSLDRIRLEGDLAMRSINARSLADKASVAGDKVLNGVDPKNASPELLLKRKQEQEQIYAQGIKEAQDRLRAANDNAATAGLPSYQRSRAEIEQKFARQNELDRGSPTALASNAQAKQAELAALAQTSIAGPIADANRLLESQNRLLNVNAATFGMSTDRVVAAKTAQEMFNRYIEAGIPITQQMRDAVLSYAEGMGKAGLAAEQLEEKQRNVVAGMDDLRSTSSSVFKSLMKGDTKGALSALGEKAMNSGADFLSDTLFGKKGKPGGGLFGDALGGLFGQSQGVAVATQTVTAGVVNVNGGLSGLGGVGGAGGIGSASTALPGLGAEAGKVSAAGHYVGNGVDPRLTDIIAKASADSPYDVKLMSGYRQGDKRFHGQGLATDVQLIDRQTGKALPNYQDAGSFGAYEQFAQKAKSVQMRDYPGLNDNFRWGGYFGGEKGKYGALDTMHFDLGGRPGIGMAGGSWEKGLNPQQMAYFPGARSQGMGDLGGATRALEQFQATTSSATTDLGTFGGGLGKMGSALFNSFTGQGGGGGGGLLGGLLGLLFGGLKFGGASAAASATPTMGGLYASGGAFSGGAEIRVPTGFGMSRGRMGLMGESGPEAVMPLSRDGSGRLGVRALAGRARPISQSNTLTVEGSTIVVQGSMDEVTGQRMKRDLDKRDQALISRFEQSFLVMNRRAAEQTG